jgi:hypothetical protein
MFCKQCGGKLDTDAKFCKSCGKPTVQRAFTAAPSPPLPRSAPAANLFGIKLTARNLAILGVVAIVLVCCALGRLGSGTAASPAAAIPANQTATAAAHGLATAAAYGAATATAYANEAKDAANHEALRLYFAGMCPAASTGLRIDWCDRVVDWQVVGKTTTVVTTFKSATEQDSAATYLCNGIATFWFFPVSQRASGVTETIIQSADGKILNHRMGLTDKC